MAQAQIQSRCASFLAQLGHRAAAAARLRKASHEEDHEPAAAVDGADWDGLERDLLPEIRKVAQDSARLGLEQVDQAIDKLLRQANARAVAWAHEHAAELVKDLENTTRERVRELVSKALDEGWSNDALAAEIQDDDVFSAGRAQTVARTETAAADVTGNLIGWEESGVVEQKEWLTSRNGNECSDCLEMDGVVVPLNEDFEFRGEKIDGPAGHPCCECDVLPVLKEENDNE